MKFDRADVGKERRSLLANGKNYATFIQKGWTPIWKISKQFPTSRKRLTGMITQFPLYLGYAFTICKSQGDSNINIFTIAHIDDSKVSRRDLYVALSRADIIENLIIVGTF